jgi:RimJ/RimL family protein N-acetyltransferase
MNRQPVLQGDRLTLRPLRPDDRDALYAVARDPQIWAVHPAHDRWREPVFEQFFAERLANGGALAIVLDATGEIIGSSCYGLPDPARPDAIEIGWSFLARTYSGGGYNAEFKRLMLGHALQWVERVTFQVGEDNVVSRKAMANIGGVLTDEQLIHERGGAMVRHVIFEITRESFAAGPLAR